MTKIKESAFRRFLVIHLRYGEEGFCDHIYNFDQYLREAQVALDRGDECYSLQPYETKNRSIATFEFCLEEANK